MKKTYLAPEMEVMKIETACMLAASLLMNDTPTIDSAGDILAPELSDEPFFDFE